MAQAQLNEEAAGILEARIAEGRPGPEVFAAAAAKQAAKGLPADAWYRPQVEVTTAPPAEPQPRPRAPVRLHEPVGLPFTLRVVRLPLATGIAPVEATGPLDTVADATR